MSYEPACVVCGHKGGLASVYERAGFTLVRCPECGLVFQHPQPTRESLQSAYYFDEGFARRLEGDLRATALARAREKLPLLLDAGVTPGGAALDVGCSSGAWMEVARDAGWEPVGVEIGEPAGAVARRRGFEVHTGTLESATELPEGAFGLITFWDVLEHLHDPLDALHRAAQLLAPDGTVALTFPNVEGWYPRLTYRLLARRTGVWEHPELPVHLYDFSPRTATRLAERAGLSVVDVRTTAVPFEFYRLTTLADQLRDRGWRGRLLGLAFQSLRWLVYPPARIFGHGNALFVIARRD